MTALADCVLVVDDEYLIAESLRMQVEDMGMAVCGIAATAKGAVALAIKHRPQLVLMDMRLAGEGDGVAAALAIHAKFGTQGILNNGSAAPATKGYLTKTKPSP